MSDDLMTGLEAAVRLAIAQYLMAYGPDMKPSEVAEIVGSRLAAAAIERLVAERDGLKEALADIDKAFQNATRGRGNYERDLGWTGSGDNPGQIFAWYARQALGDT